MANGRGTSEAGSPARLRCGRTCGYHQIDQDLAAVHNGAAVIFGAAMCTRPRSRLVWLPAWPLLMTCRIACCWTALALAAVVVLVPDMGLAQPTVTHVVPGAVQPGKTTELIVFGTKLTAPVEVWTSFSGTVAVLPAEGKAAGEKAVHCRVTLPANVQPGIVGLAVATAVGASDVAYFMVDVLPSVADAAGNDTPPAAQEISLPVAVDGASGGTLADYFRFSAKAGARVSCEVVANRLGWDFDPLVRVLDAAGNELLLADDDAASGVDPRFVFTAPADGSYVIELRDNRYKPGGRYRLRLGDFPLVTTPMPLMVQRGSQNEVTFLGPQLNGVSTTNILIPGGVREGVAATGINVTGRASPGWTTLGLAEIPVHAEEADAGSCELPCIVSGVIGQAGEVDAWRFAATKGAQLRFRAITRSLGSAAVLSLKVTDAAGKQVAASPVTESDEPVLAFAAASDGDYRLVVEELAGRGGTDFGYAVECRRGPQFSLVLKNDKNNRLRYAASAGGAFYLDVQAQRAGFDGPIKLSIDTPRSGWQVFSHVIAAKANETRMYVVPPPDWEAGDITDLRVSGRGEAGEDSLRAVMSTTVQLRASRPHFPYPPAWHDGTVFVSGLAAKPAIFSVTSPAVVDFDSEAGQGKLAIEMERIDAKFKDTALTVIPVGLPAGLAAEIKRSGNGPKETYEVLLKGPKKMAAGPHTFRFFAYAELNGEGRGFYSGDVRIVIREESALAEKKAAAP
jgi:hypothetical protein